MGTAIIHPVAVRHPGLDYRRSAGSVVSRSLPGVDDEDPIVIVEDEPEPTAQAYLRSVGVSDPVTWAAFGIGSVDDAVLARFGLAGRRRPQSQVVLLPTRDPRAPAAIVGVVKLAPAQHKHGFATAPAGIGCPAAIASAQRVLLCDTPLTALRLHQAGVQHIALCEDPAVLPPLVDWLRERAIVLLSHTQRGLEAMAGVVADLPHTAHLIGSDPARMAAEVRRLLALPSAPPPPRVDPTPHLLHRIADYARARLRAGDGAEAIQARQLAQADLLEVYGAGYLPADWQQVLSRADEPMMTGRRIGNALIVPAVDGDGVVVDLLAYRLESGGHTAGCWDAPRGLLGARVITVFRDLILVDRVADLARLWAEGHRNLLLLRDVTDLEHNTARLVAAGVKAVRIDTWHDRPLYARTCLRAGLRAIEGPTLVTNPHGPPLGCHHCSAQASREEPTDDALVIVLADDVDDAALCAEDEAAEDEAALVLIDHDPERGLATFQAGEITYVVDVPWEPITTLEVLARRLGQVHRDRFDLASAAQRGRYADAAGRRVQVEPPVIDGHLVAILDLVRELWDASDAPAVSIPIDTDTQSLLRDPALLDQLVASLDAAGWVGDDAAKRLGLLCIAGRLLDDPPWLLLRGPASVTAGPLGLLADCVLPEYRLHCSRLTESSLYHQDRDALRHRVLILDDAATLRAEALTSLRILQTRGGLAVTQAERDPATGRLRTRATDARGPVAVLSAAASDTTLADLAMSMQLDASPAQTARVMAAQAHRRQGGDDPRPQTVERLRAVLRCLERLPVLIPFADRIDFPATRLEHRRDHDRFLALIEASALLHQQQRPRVDGRLIATEADFYHALAAAGAVLGQIDNGLSDRAGPILTILRTQPDHDWTMSAIATALPHLSRGTLRRALDDLIRADVVVSPRAGRGRQARIYHLVDVTAHPTTTIAIRLLPIPATPTRNWPIDQGVTNNLATINRPLEQRYA